MAARLPVAVLVLVLGACSTATQDAAEPQPSRAAPSASPVAGPARPTGSSEFQARALADKAVSRAELEQAYAHYFHCLRAKGVEGEVQLDLDLSPVARTSLGLAPGVADPDGSRLDAALDGCAGQFIDPLVSVYEEQHADPPELLARKKAITMACLRRLDPALAATVDPAMSYPALREFTIGQASSSGSSCATELDIPVRKLADLTGP